MKKDFIEIFKELKRIKFSFIVLYLISLALLYQYAYYKAFNIDITTFISISDLYVIFIDLLPGLIYFLGFTILILIIVVFFIRLVALIPRLIINDKTKTDEETKISEKQGSIVPYVILNFMTFAVFYASITVYAFPFMMNRPDDGSFYNIASLVFRFILILYFIFVFISQLMITGEKFELYLKEIKITIHRYRLLLFALMIFYVTGLSATLNAGRKIRFHPTETIEFQYKGEKLSSNINNVVYVGSTSNYIFLFFKDSAITKSYKTSEVVNLSFYNSIFHNELKDRLFWKTVEEDEELLKTLDSIIIDSMNIYQNKRDSILPLLIDTYTDSLLQYKEKKKQMNELKLKIKN